MLDNFRLPGRSNRHLTNIEDERIGQREPFRLIDGRLQALMGDQACKSPAMAVEFIRPFYAAALAMITNVAGELALTTA